MATILQQVEQATGRDKLVVLASVADQLLESQRSREKETSIDDQLETLDVSSLAAQYEVSLETLRRQIIEKVGTKAVFKLGKKWVIRKRKFLEYLQVCESDPG